MELCNRCGKMSAYPDLHTGEVICCSYSCTHSSGAQTALEESLIECQIRIKALEEENKKLKKLAHDRLAYIADMAKEITNEEK